MYALELLNKTGTKVAQLMQDECSVKVKRVINGEWSININYTVNANNDKMEFFNLRKVKARIVNLKNIADYTTFILNKPNLQKSANGSIVLSVDGLHESIDSMKTEVVAGVFDFQSEHPALVLAKILSFSTKYTLGTYPAIMTPVSIKLSWETVLSSLQRLLELSGAEYSVNEVAGTLSIYTALGATNKYIHIRPGRNLKSIKMVRYEDSITNKMHGIGGGDYPATIAGARHRVQSLVGNLISVEHNKLVPENDTWNTYKIKVETGTLAGQFFTITDSTHNTTYDSVLCSGTLTGLIAGDCISICNSNNSYVNYIIANNSVVTNGLQADVYKNTKYSNTINEVKTATLDGVYTAGLCQDYTKFGTPTVSKNTNVAFIKYGSASQRAQSTADGQGVYQSVRAAIGEYYVVKAYIYIVSGTVRLRIVMGSKVYQLTPIGATSDPVITGWQTFEAKVKSIDDDVILSIEQDGSGTAEFYIDAMQLSETNLVDGDLEDRKFIKISEQTELWFETFDKLMKQKDPKVEYQANFLDLNKISPLDYPFEQIDIGDTVLITDKDIGVDAIPARITQVNYDAFRPELTEHTITTTSAL